MKESQQMHSATVWQVVGYMGTNITCVGLRTAQFQASAGLYPLDLCREGSMILSRTVLTAPVRPTSSNLLLSGFGLCKQCRQALRWLGY